MWWIGALAAPDGEANPEQVEQTGTTRPQTTEQTKDAQPATAEEPVPMEPVAPVSKEKAETYAIPTLGAELPSALHTGKLEADQDDGSLKAMLAQYGMSEDDFGRKGLISGGWFVRPRFAVTQLFDATRGPLAVRTGLSAGRRFWTLQALPVQLAADLGLRFTAPIGGASGRRLEGFANIGPWLGPARIQIGLAARWEREFWHRQVTELRDVVQLGAMVQVALDLKVLQTNFGFSPMGKVWGERTSASNGNPVLPVLGHETTWTVGVAAPVGVFRLGTDVAWRDTDAGGLLEVGLVLGLDLAALRRATRSNNEDQEEDE